MQDLLISIIIPVYNAESVILKNIEYLKKQNYHYLEIIIINDGSTDKTDYIIKKAIDGDERFIYLYKKNGGVSSARNYGICKATGDYIIFVDADDYLEETAITVMLDCMKKNNCDISCFGFKYVKSFNRIDIRRLIDNNFQIKSYDDLTNLLENIPNAPWGKVFLRNVIINNNIFFDESVPYAEDTIFFIKYLSYIDKITISSEVVYNYVFLDRNNQASKKYYDKLLDYYVKVMQEKETFCIRNGLLYDKQQDIKIYLEKIVEHRIIHRRYDGIEHDFYVLNSKVNIKEYIQKWKWINKKKIIKAWIKNLLCFFNRR